MTISKKEKRQQAPQNQVLQAAKDGRQQGYLEGIIEFAYSNNIDIGISEEDYNQFLELKERCDKDNSFQNLNRLMEMTRNLFVPHESVIKL